MSIRLVKILDLAPPFDNGTGVVPPLISPHAPKPGVRRLQQLLAEEEMKRLRARDKRREGKRQTDRDLVEVVNLRLQEQQEQQRIEEEAIELLLLL